jgi:acetyl esterase/lipase
LTKIIGTSSVVWSPGADSVELAAKARAADVPIELHLRQGQPHNYVLMPTPEGREARAIILRFIAQGLT